MIRVVYGGKYSADSGDSLIINKIWEALKAELDDFLKLKNASNYTAGHILV